MENVDQFQTVDMDANDVLYIFVKVWNEEIVYLGLSLERDGDVQVGLTTPAARRLVAALTLALARAELRSDTVQRELQEGQPNDQ